MGEFLGFSGGDAGASAAAASERFNQQAIDELRRQFNVTQGQFQPFIQAGQEQLGALTQGTTAAGLDERLGGIFGSENFQNLRDERTRALEGAASAGGLTRSGGFFEEAENIPTQLGFDLEKLLTGRSQQLAGQGLGAVGSLGSFGAGTSGNIANLLSQTGQTQAAGMFGDAQSRAAANQNIIGVGGSILGSLFSDPALKENVEEIGKINDLTLVQWDWKPEFEDTIVSKCSTIGFMADEVEDKYPHHVGQFGGFMVINYEALLNELEAA